VKIQPSEAGCVTALGRIDIIFIVFLSFPPARHCSRSGEAGGDGSTKTQCRLKAANENQTYLFQLKADFGKPCIDIAIATLPISAQSLSAVSLEGPS